MFFQQPASALATSFLASAIAFQTATAQSPPEFSPVVSNHLNVTYGTTAVNPAGITVPGSSVTNAPDLKFCSAQSASYIAVLMDFSVAGILPVGNTTLIHWIQENLTSSACTKTLTSVSSAIAPYTPPGPPAGQTHTYGVFLYAQPANFAVPADYIPYFNNLTASIYNRVGFNLTKFAGETGLKASVAANWFMVSTPNVTTSSSAAISTVASATGSGSVATQSTSGGSAMKVGMTGMVVGLFVAMMTLV